MWQLSQEFVSKLLAEGEEISGASGQKSMISSLLLALFLSATCDAYLTEQQKEKCRRVISDYHMQNLSELIDAQMKTDCRQRFGYVDESELADPVCFLKAAYSPLENILDKIDFKSNTPSSEKLIQLRKLHFELEECIIHAHEREESKRCLKDISLTAEEVLQRVHDYFKEAKKQLHIHNFVRDCSRVFQKCSDSREKKTTPAGVVADQSCRCPGTGHINGGLSASLLLAPEPLSSIADQLDSKETAASTLQLAVLPGTTQTQGGSEGSTKPRVSRSTLMSPGSAESMDFRVGTDALMSSPSEEPVLAVVPQGPAPVTTHPASLLDPDFPRLKSIPHFPSSQQHVGPMGMESPLPGSEAGSSQTQPNEFSLQDPSFSGSAKLSPSKQAREMDPAMPESTSDWDVADTSSTSSLSLASVASLKPVYSSRVPSSGRLATFLPRDPELFPTLGSEEFGSATDQPSTTGSSSSPRQISPESYSWGEQGSEGRAPANQQSTQVREKRARQEEGLAQEDREPEDSMLGPHFDLNLIPPNTDKHSKKPEARDTQGMAVIYVVVPSVLGILLAVGGLLFYFHKSRMLARRRLQRNMEVQEGRPLNGGQEHVELQMQEEV
ncbi:macrophage colony-stimulating factor 1 isoform X3 [Hemicordylus capensis]|uniref:macrophage colony-stimulating factor 1 isoform X3 n=1 Tax=Hemicordylus capensis TaxID=884348 RepID=UPI002302AB5C|nr:macrophage colony-stimulating factor 1 isoform X3 [Hemicordylus capensis]